MRPQPSAPENQAEELAACRGSATGATLGPSGEGTRGLAHWNLQLSSGAHHLLTVTKWVLKIKGWGGRVTRRGHRALQRLRNQLTEKRQKWVSVNNSLFGLIKNISCNDVRH